MPTMNLGQVYVKTILKISTRLNTATTGLSDVLIDIYNPSGSKVVDNGSMEELGSTGIYQYAYTVPNVVGTYTAVITCASQRNYDELQTFVATTMQGGGGMVVQYPAKVIDKEEIKEKKKLMELLIKIDERISALIKKNPKKDIEKTEKEIKKRIEELNKEFKEMMDKQQGSTESMMGKYTNDSNKLWVNGIADFTSKIYQLQENTKLLPNSLNSLLISAEKANTSKFNELKEIIKKNDDESKTLTSKFSDNINDKNKLIDSKIDKMKDELSSQVKEIIPSIVKNNSELTEQITLIKKDIDSKEGYLKDYVELFGRIDKVAQYLKDYNGFLTNKFLEIEQRTALLTSINLNLLNLARGDEQNKNLASYAESLKGEITRLEKDIDFFKSEALKSISKIPDRRDLNYTQEYIVGNIKEAQSNNTKKVKELRDNISEVKNDVEITKNEIKEDNKKLKRQIRIAEEENNLNAQLSTLNQEKLNEEIDES